MTCARCGSEGFGCYECTPDPFAIIARLTADLDAALAQVAGAYEAAAEAAYQSWWDGDDAHELSDAIRALTPDDATAALDRIKRQARAEGMRMAAEIANGCGREVDPQDGSYVCHHPLRGPLFRAAILAAAKQEEQQ